jgi:hypothetical protein
VVDASEWDAAIVIDARPDAASADAATPDAATPDAAMPDAAMADAPLPDAATTDAAVADAELPDAELSDAPLPDGNANTPGAVVCDDLLCLPPSICCVTQIGSTAFVECTAELDCSALIVTCDGPEDCDTATGEPCCLVPGEGTWCSSGQCFAQVCHDKDDCPEATDECCETPVGGGYCSSFGCF